MLEHARELTAAERLDNVRYELGDAQVHHFDAAGFDVAISRFGTMFFADPAAAFANIAAALRPGARLVLLVWQRREDNEWMRAIDAALGDAARAPQPGADAFSLGDAGATAGILEGAGFDGIRFEDVREPVLYGHDLDAALAIVRGFQDTSAALASLSDGEAARTVERLRETLAAPLQRRARRGPRFPILVDHRAATPLTTRYFAPTARYRIARKGVAKRLLQADRAVNLCCWSVPLHRKPVVETVGQNRCETNGFAGASIIACAPSATHSTTSPASCARA